MKLTKDPEPRGTEDFPGIYRYFHRPILGFVLRSVSDRHVAEELTQDVFLKAFRAQHTFDGRQALAPWLWAIARNTVRDWQRRRSGAPVLAGTEGGAVETEQVACPRLDAESLIVEASNRQALAKCLESLTELQRKVLSMRLVQRLSYREISEALGLSLASAKCLVYRARITLAQSLELAHPPIHGLT